MFELPSGQDQTIDIGTGRSFALVAFREHPDEKPKIEHKPDLAIYPAWLGYGRISMEHDQ